jgi:ribosome-associated protein
MEIAKAAEERRALDLVVLDMQEMMSLCDFFVICHGRSRQHVQAIADAVEEHLEPQGVRVKHREGKREGRWVLLDYLNVVVHVFTEDTRDFYDLERLWADAPVIYAAEAQDVIGFLDE